MKFQKLFSALKSGALVAGLTFAAACGDDGGFTALPGDYEGVGVFVVDDDVGYIHVTLTLADDGTVTGSGTAYDAGTGPLDVPDGDDTFTFTGTAGGHGVDILFDDEETTGTGTVNADGSISFELANSESSSFDGTAVVVSAPDGETGIACGEFGFGPDGTEGAAAFLASNEGFLYGVFASDDFRGTLEGEFEVGISCGADTCNSEITGTLDGTFDGEAVSFDVNAGMTEMDFEEDEGSGSFVGAYGEVALDGDPYFGGFLADTYYCDSGSYD